ncbi:MAG: VOC family protein [Pseudomonadaceae bacterium]|nr:VOC family protein [Pseudomonadaceae bacterium]
MLQPNGLHHVAISTGDMKGQIEYFSDVLGMELVALYWMHGVENTFHGFMKMGEAAVAFVFKEENKDIETVIGQTHSGNAGNASAPGTMQHIAFNVDTLEDLLAMRDRIRSRGIVVMGPLNHGMCHSIYFAGPENLALEISTSGAADSPLDLKGTWIDPEVVGLAGINEDELKRYMAPAEYSNDNDPLPNPAVDPSKPQMVYPKGALEMIAQAPDEAMLNSVESAPPSPSGL